MRLVFAMVLQEMMESLQGDDAATEKFDGTAKEAKLVSCRMPNRVAAVVESSPPVCRLGPWVVDCASGSLDCASGSLDYM